MADTPASAANDPVDTSGTVARELVLSPSVESAAAKMTGSVTASAFAAAILDSHPEYAGGRAGKLRLDPGGGRAVPVSTWLQQARGLLDDAAAPLLHGRIVLLALSRLDVPLAGQLEREGVLDALEGEIKEPLSALFPPRDDPSEASQTSEATEAPEASGTADPSPAPELDFDFLASAASDLPSKEDVLGFRPLVSALYTLLDDPKTVLPLAVAVTAPWGAGKSSVMYQLKDMMNAPPEGSAAHRTWRTVHFDAWKYERSERLWAALAKAIYEQPQRAMTLRQKLGFRLRLERERLGGWKLLAAFGWPFLAAIVTVLGVFAADLSSNATLITLASSAAAITAGAKHYSDLVLNPFRRAIERHAKRPDYEEQLGFTAEADHDVRALTRVLAPDDDHALAVFVDDLDRCSSAHVVEVVEAMNQIFNAAEDHRCAFVLGLDRDVVATSIEVVYQDTVARLVAAKNPLGDRFGLEFLAKLVQLTVAIPQPNAGAIRDLLSRVTDNAMPRPEPELSEGAVDRAQAEIRRVSKQSLSGVGEAASQIEAEDAEPAVVEEAARRERALLLRDSQEVIDAEFSALKHLERNPRQVKRFHNAFRLQLYVANADPLVLFDFTPDQLIALAKWVTVRLRWPEFGDDIAEQPELLTVLEATANEDALSPQQLEVRDVLKARHGRWFDEEALCKVLLETRRERRIDSLPLDTFLRVA